MTKKANTNSIHRYSKVDTDIGSFWIACSPQGITAIRPASESKTVFESGYEKLLGERPRNGRIPDSFREALKQAVKGESSPSGLIDWTRFTKFQQKVLKQLHKIPAGTIRTYSWLARQSGHPKAARAVGNVMAGNPVPFLLPCHRIVPSTGGIGNYGLGKELKRKLLRREGVTLK